MARGRRPKPSALKEMQGNAGKRRKIKVSAGPSHALTVPDSLAPPPELKPAERKIWNQLLPLLRERKFVQMTDLLTFTRYCKFFALWSEMAPKVNAKNLVKVTKSDFVEMERLSKSFLVLMYLDKRMCEHEANFALNPAARQSFLVRAAAQTPRLPFEEPEAAKKGESAPHPAEQGRPQSPIGIGRLN